MPRAPVGQTNIFDSKSSPEGHTDISSRHYNYLLHAYFFKLVSSLGLYSISIRASIMICNHSKEHQFAVTIWKVRSRNSIKKRTDDAMTKNTMSIRNQWFTKCYTKN